MEKHEISLRKDELFKKAFELINTYVHGEHKEEIFSAIIKIKDYTELLEKSCDQKQVSTLPPSIEIVTRAVTKIQATIRGNNVRRTFQRYPSIEPLGTTVLRKYILKSDRLPGCTKLSYGSQEEAPNFRRFENLPIYGGAQPSLNGLHLVLEQIARDGFTNVIWINLREEAVIVVDGDTFTARRSLKLNENDLVPGIAGHTIEVVEKAMKQSLMEQLCKNSCLFEYWSEKELGENQLVTKRVDSTQVYSLHELYKPPLLKSSMNHVEYYRIPIERENAPEHADLEKIIALVRKADQNTAVVFNCQMGRGRTTTATVLAALVWKLENKSLSPSGIFSEMTLDDLRSPADPNENLTRADGGHRSGVFKVIRYLLQQLPQALTAKSIVDEVIDSAAVIYNIRDVINETKERLLMEAKPSRRQFYLHRTCRLLERYFYLLVFASYLLTKDHEEESPLSVSSSSSNLLFSQWIQRYPFIFRLLDDLGAAKYIVNNILQDYVLKLDHFPGMRRLATVLGQGAPNFRRIDTCRLYGVGQCDEESIYDVIRRVTLQDGYKKVIWINLREEAVIYVRGRAFVVRNPKNLLENIEYPGIEVNEILKIENTLKNELISVVQKADGFFLYWHEPTEYVNEETTDHIVPETEIQTERDIYRTINKRGYAVRYARIPVSDETAPEEKDIDDLVRLVFSSIRQEIEDDVPISQQTAIVCNCQMGRGRTTTGLVCIMMLIEIYTKFRLKTPNEIIAMEEPYSIHEDKGTEIMQRRKTGNYMVIVELVNTLENGSLSKRIVDKIIDQCAHLQNLRECIADCRDMAKDRSLSAEKHDFYMRRAVNYLERYFYLICYASYLLEQVNLNFQMLFVTWMSSRYEMRLYHLLDNLFFDKQDDEEIHLSSMRWRWRRKRKMISRVE